MLLDGQVALVIGGAGGIGRAIARRYVAEGARVAIGDIDERAGAEVAAVLGAADGRAIFVRCDATDEGAVDALVTRTEAELGPIDVAVCAAGVTGPYRAFHELGLDELDHVLRINLHGPFLVGKAVARRMLAADRGGAIINVSSVGAVLAVPDLFAYSVSKAALGMATTAMAISVAGRGIRVNAIAPGPVDSPMQAHVGEDARRMMLSRTPLGRIATPEEIAGIAVFLAGPDAGYVVGQTIYADGGRMGLAYLVDRSTGDQ